MLRTALLAALLLLASSSLAEDGLRPDLALAHAEQRALTIIDVRLPAEWAETGLPAGAAGVSLQDPRTLEPRPGFVEDVLRAVGGDRDRPIAVICAGGVRSAFARELLVASGFSQVEDISEGVLGGPDGPGWLARALPTTPCKVC